MGYLMNISDATVEKTEDGYRLVTLSAYGYDPMTVPPGTPGAPMAKMPSRAQKRSMVPMLGRCPVLGYPCRYISQRTV